MHVAYICSEADIPLLGPEGRSSHVREFLHGLIDAGHSVEVLCANADGPHAVDEHVGVHWIAPSGYDAAAWPQLEAEAVLTRHHLTRDLRTLMWNRWLADAAEPLFAARPPDILYARHALLSWGSATLRRRHRVPLILEVNAPLTHARASPAGGTLPATAERMELEVIRAADAIVTVSARLRDWLTGRGADADRIRVIPNAVCARRFAEPGRGAAIRQSLGIADRRVIGLLGCGQPWYDTAGLIQAFRDILSERGDALLLLVGDGPGRGRLEDQVRAEGLTGAVHFTGFIDPAQVPDYLAAMDVAALPGRDDPDPPYGSPRPLFEYMAAGRPTVAAAWPQVADVMDHGRTGWLYPPGDNHRLGEGLRILMRDPALCDAMGSAARAHVLRNHTWQAVAQEVAALAAEVIRGPPWP